MWDSWFLGSLQVHQPPLLLRGQILHHGNDHMENPRGARQGDPPRGYRIQGNQLKGQGAEHTDPAWLGLTAVSIKS